jgi:zinc protease
MKFLKLGAAAITLAAAGAFAQSTAANIAIPDIPYTKFVLKNGLTVLVHEDHKLPVVAVNTWYHVGSKNERPGKTGFAHLFEHLMFSGSENFNHTYLSQMTLAGATSLNGTTSNDRTNYFQNVPTSMLDYALFAESDRMGHLLGVLDQKKLDLQRGVVQNEKRQGESRPYGLVNENIVKNTWPAGHPYSWTVIGSMADLDAASMADVQEWFRTYYGPNNVTLVLAGDITPEQAKQKVEKYYGDIPPGPPLAKNEAWVAKRTGTHRGTMQDRVPQARVYRVWNVPGDNTAPSALLDLAAQVLGGGKTSRLYKRLVYRDQVATSADAENDSNEIAGQFDLVLTARPGADVAAMERSADEELRALMASGPTAAELALAKTTILARYARTMERVGGFGGKSDLLAACTTYTGNPACYKTYLERIRAATPAAVQQAMKQWLSDGDYVLTVTPYPDVAAAPSTLDRKSEPAFGKSETLKLPTMHKAQLSNGLKVVVAERHEAPVVNLSLIVDSGYASDPQDKPGLANLTLKTMEEGTARRDSLKISEELESLGAQFSVGANLDSAFVNMNALKPTLPQALDLYADIVLHPAFPQREFARLQKDQFAAIQRERSNLQTMGTRVIPSLLYGAGHAYSRPMSGSGTEAGVRAITQADLAKYHATWFKPNNATLLVVGDTSLAEITPLLERAFAGWKSGEVPKKNLAQAPARDKPVVYLMDKPGAPQSVIYGAQIEQPVNARENVELQVVNNVFGGNFSSRLNMNLREDKHWSYGVRSDVPLAQGQRLFMSRSPVQWDKTKEALQEVVREYADAAGGKPFTEAEIAEARSRETLALPGSFETTGQLSNAYSAIIQYKLPEDYFSNVTPTVLAFTPAQANAIAKRVIAPSQMIYVVVGDMAKVEQGVRDLKIGEVVKLDADGNVVR